MRERDGPLWGDALDFTHTIPIASAASNHQTLEGRVAYCSRAGQIKRGAKPFVFSPFCAWPLSSTSSCDFLSQFHIHGAAASAAAGPPCVAVQIPWEKLCIRNARFRECEFPRVSKEVEWGKRSNGIFYGCQSVTARLQFWSWIGHEPRCIFAFPLNETIATNDDDDRWNRRNGRNEKQFVKRSFERSRCVALPFCAASFAVSRVSTSHK